MARMNYQVQTLETRDRSMLLCFGSLLLFILVVALIFLMIWGIRKGVPVTVEEPVVDKLTGNVSTEMPGDPSEETTDQTGQDTESTSEQSTIQQPIPHPTTTTTRTTTTTEQSTTQTTSTTVSTTTEHVYRPIGETVPEIEPENETSNTGDTEIGLRTERVENKQQSGTQTFTKGEPPASVQCHTEGPVCDSKVCKQKAGMVLSMMDRSQNPTSKFYRFACGGLQDNHLLREPNPEEVILEKLLGQVGLIDQRSPAAHQTWKQFYHSCLDFPSTPMETRRESLNDVTREVEETAAGNVDMEVLTKLIAKLLLANTAPLFDVDLEPETNQGASTLTFVLTPPSQSTDWPWMAHLKAAACPMPEDSAPNPQMAVQQQGECENNFSKSMSDLEDQTGPDFEFMKSATSNSTFLDEMRSLKNYTVVTVEDLQVRYQGIRWPTLLTALTNSSTPIQPEAVRVHIYLEEHFRRLSDHLLSRRPVDVAKSLVQVLQRRLEKAFLQDTSCRDDRALACMRLTSALFKDVSSALYLNTFSTKQRDEISATVLSVYPSVLKSYQNIIKSSRLDDFDEASVQVLLGKLSGLTFITDGGFPVFRQPNFLESRMQEVVGGSFIERYMAAMKRNRKLKYGTWGGDAKLPENIWTHYLSPLDSEIVVVHELNSIVIPYGLYSLQHLAPLPKYLSFADFGWAVAAAIGKTLDQTGIKFDGQGQFYEAGLQGFRTGLSLYTRTFAEMYNRNSFTLSHVLGTKFVDYSASSPVLVNEIFVNYLGLHAAYSAPSPTPWLALPFLNLTAQQAFYVVAVQGLCRKFPIRDFVRFQLDQDRLPPFISTERALSNQEGFIKAYGGYYDEEMNLFAYVTMS